ncbi:Ig-like domain-containing protein [Ruania zhangjianzhongii]|uniref:Ig-like domain-containing protein n=1 Tax=Ruania zhangjianzhongii TaxID=2603206 RepID=UPI0011CA41BD|nr:Ig-like domain-containing protein [Ruania zhangjianzhongii]
MTTPETSGLSRRGLIAGAAVAGTALVAIDQLSSSGASAAPDAPSADPISYADPPPQPAAVVGNTVPAFPGAEGAGKLTTGGRGGEVYEVTTLADSGEGSLREALSGDDRIVVFRVGGTIELESGLDVTGSNITVAGQTAPGDGISVINNEFSIKGDNIIIRYLRVRAGDSMQAPVDAFKAEDRRNLVIDHCSVSWGVDECFSLYGNYDVTVQYCILAEGLTMSAHEKGRHGYGGLWGGQNVTYHHNLLIHQGGRNPRYSFVEDMKQLVDQRYNVIYNHGFTTAYGGEWAEGINMVGNYYKPGPATLSEVASKILTADRGGSWYVAENLIEGDEEVTADNEKGIGFPAGGISLLSEPVEFVNAVPDQTAEEAYEDVLADVGCNIPRYDSVDARLLADVRHGTGRLINSQTEVGGYPVIDGGEPLVDSDHDGIPDDWEAENGLDPQDPADAAALADDGSGYTNLELYLNSITGTGASPTVAIASPAPHQVFSSTADIQQVTITAEAEGQDGAAIENVDFFVNDELVGSATSAPFEFTWPAATDGTYYLIARARDEHGAKVDSTGTPIHVNQTSDLGAWTSTDIGDVAIPGSAFIDDVRGDIVLKGAGKIRGRQDDFQFLHQRVRARENDVVEIIARIDGIDRTYEGAYAGLMIRESLEADSPYFTGGLCWEASGYKGRVSRISYDGDQASVGGYPYDDSELDVKEYWIRIIKRGTEFECHLGTDSLQWTRIGYERIPMRSDRMYIGLAVDANKEANAVENYTVGRFASVRINS